MSLHLHVGCYSIGTVSLSLEDCAVDSAIVTLTVLLLYTEGNGRLSLKGGVTWIRHCCKGMCSTWALRLISGNHVYATAALLSCPRALMRIVPFSEPGKLAFLWFAMATTETIEINKAHVRYVACITR